MTQNNQLFAVFNSAHKVMKAENVLKQSNLAILLIPAPRALSTDCGLAIRYDSEISERVFQTLSDVSLLPDVIYNKVSDTQYDAIWNADNI
ncbi:MAG: DUF3343 domain-containing protein [Desulfuromonadaceae bacterium]|nr:DUF3343 domain-containing protein [Desulfuromonadaceae bacterium]